MLRTAETWEADALNATTTQRTLSGGGSPTRDTITYAPATGRVDRTAAQRDGAWQWLAPAVYDGAGNQHLVQKERLATTCGYNGILCEESSGGYFSRYYFTEVVASYYGADNRLRVTDRLTSDTWYYQHVGGLEEYRYDALGRRVLRRFRGDPKWTGTEWIMDGEIVRYVYDGEQILYEIRMPGQDSSSATTLERDFDPNFVDPRYGTVQYTHGLALDRPLSAARLENVFFGDYKGQTVFLHENYRGYFTKGTLSNGSRDGGLVNWRGRRLSTILESQSPYGTGSDGFPFFGSLLDVQTDGSAQVYMRNRYYDPVHGRFTQEDPIGLAGGLNLYGFANGDPVNFSDPFGLLAMRDDITFNMKGEEIDRVKNDKPDRYFLNTGSRSIQIDRPLSPNNPVSGIVDAPGAISQIATALVGAAPKYSSLGRFRANSHSGGTLDFKRQLHGNILWNAGNGMYWSNDKVGNVAWGHYAKSVMGYGLSFALAGAQYQAISRTGSLDDPLDQAAIRRGYAIP